MEAHVILCFNKKRRKTVQNAWKRKGHWWPSRTSNPVHRVKSSVGGFDSHALPPFDFKGLLIYLLRPLRRFLWSARGTNSFKTRRKGYKEKNLLRNETWCPSCLYGYSINVYTTIILDLYNVVYFKQLFTDLCHSINSFNLE